MDVAILVVFLYIFEAYNKIKGVSFYNVLFVSIFNEIKKSILQKKILKSQICACKISQLASNNSLMEKDRVSYMTKFDLIWFF